MRSEDVVNIYRELERAGVAVWIDGGWAIDALVGRQTRGHKDLDVAVEANSVPAFREVLTQRRYRPDESAEPSEWNFVLIDEQGRKIDVHIVILDEHTGVLGAPLGGVPYPAGSLTGEGVIAGEIVRCVNAEFMLQFKTSYPPRDIDRMDVAELCALLGRPVPDSHR